VLKQIADARPVPKTAGLHGQALDPKHSEDAAFRALARHPEASVAWKDPAALEEHDRKALRKAFHRYHGANEGEEIMRRWHDDHPEPPHEARGRRRAAVRALRRAREDPARPRR
jgi:hypothetical protein